MQKEFFKNRIKTFPPVYFALPMSTGILAVACYTLEYEVLSWFFYAVSGVELGILLLLFLSRILFFFSYFKRDLAVPSIAAGFLTLVCAICLLGVNGILLHQFYRVALICWGAGLFLWLLFIYVISVLTVIEEKKPSIRNSINGSWLLFVVSAQSLSILGNLVARHLSFDHKLTVFISLVFYFIGALFYLIIISLISYRYAFYKMRPKEFRPSYWINMGAAAISTLSGSVLVEAMTRLEVYVEFVPVFKVFTFLFWIGGTWWIPLILYLEIWKRSIIRVAYNPENWSLVFPLGMYTVCTWHFAGIMDLDFLKDIPEGTIFIALLIWGILYFKMIISRIKKNKVIVRQSKSS